MSAATTDAPSVGFELLHQKVSLAVDLRGRLHGFTELTLTPTSGDLKTVYIHSRCNILAVSIVGSGPAKFSHVDPLAATSKAFTPTAPDHVTKAFPELKRKLFAGMCEASEGELAISLPEGSLRALDEGGFEPIVISIDYEAVKPRDGVRFAGLDGTGSPLPHAYTTSISPDAARCWMPCLDDVRMRCTWQLDLIVPSSLSIGDGSGSDEEMPIVAVASGELVEQVAHPSSSTQTIFRYSLLKATAAQHIAFAVGPFRVLDLPATQHRTHCFYLPVHEAIIESSLSFLPKAMDLIETEAGTYPFDSYRAVFIDDSDYASPGAPVQNAASLTLFPSDLLHPPSVVEQAYDTRQIVSHALAQQWFGILVMPKLWEDTWLVVGLALRLASLAVRKLLGNNEYRFRLRKDADRCVDLDIHMPPLCQPGQPEPHSADALAFLALKAPLVLHALDRQLLKSGSSVGLSRVLNQLSNSVISDQLKGNLLSTNAFFRLCRKLARNDSVRAFAQQWVFSSGCPRFYVKREFDRKRMAIFITVRQESPAWKYVTEKKDWPDTACLRPVQLFEGQMVVRIHEADGTPYEHVLDIRDAEKRHEVPFNTKYKRVRRGTRRFGGRTTQAALAAAGDTEAQQDIELFDPSFDLPMWEEAEERDRWRVTDWSEEDITKMETQTFEWIRLDAEFEWIATIQHEQPADQYISQLQFDRDVVAQMEAIQALALIPPRINELPEQASDNMRKAHEDNVRHARVVASHLAKTVLVSNYFYRIRIEAVFALVAFSTRALEFIGIFYLLRVFQSKYCYPPEAEYTGEMIDWACLPKPNDFANLPEYFLQKALVIALSHLRDDDGKCWPEIQGVLTQLLRYNDNTRNTISDSSYLATIMAALSKSLIPTSTVESSLFAHQNDDMDPNTEREKQLVEEAVAEVERYLSMDRLVPSYRNAVTIACLEWKTKLMLASLLPADIRETVSYTREGNYAPIRIAAFDCMLLLKALENDGVVEYMFAVLAADQAPLVRRRLAKSIVDSTLAFAALEDLETDHSTMALEIFDEIGSAKAVETATAKRARVVGELKARLGKRAMIRGGILKIIASPAAELAVRLPMLKLCDVIFTPKAEPLQLQKLKLKVSLSGLPRPMPRPRQPSQQDDNYTPEDALPARGSPDIPLQQIVTNPIRPFKKPKTPGAGGTPKTPKPKKIKMPRAPRGPGGMPFQDEVTLKSFIEKVNNHPKSIFFRQPVDPVRDKAKGYFSIVQRPMDLSTMLNKLKGGYYQHRSQVYDDFKLMIDNAVLYNGEASRVAADGMALETYFEAGWKQVEEFVRKYEERAALAAGMTVPPPPGQHSQSQPEPTGSGSTTIKLKAPKPPHTASSTLPPSSMKIKLKTSVGPSTEGSGSGATPVETSKRSNVTFAETPRASPAPPSHPPVPMPGPSRSTPPPQAIAPRPAPAAKLVKSNRPAMPTRFVPDKAKQIIQRIMAMDEAFFFREPVPATLEAYHAVITEPRDLGTMLQDLDDDNYESNEAIDADFAQMARNCYLYNPPGSIAIGSMRVLEKAWSDSWKRVNADLIKERKRAQVDIIKTLMGDPTSAIFHFAVDPIALGIPDYFQKIRREDARDLSLMKKKAEEGRYATWAELDEDVQLMVRNATTYNPEGTWANGKAREFDEVRRRVLEPLLGTRKHVRVIEEDDEEESEAKKARLN